MAYAGSTYYSNVPILGQGHLPASITETLDMPQFNAYIGTSAVTQAAAIKALGNPAAADAFIKGIRHDAVYVGGTPSDINFFTEWAGGTVGTSNFKEIWNRYVYDQNLNVFFAATRTASNPSVDNSVWVTLTTSCHVSQGTLSEPFPNSWLYCKQTGQWFTVINVDKSVPYAHKFQIITNDGTTPTISANQPYTVLSIGAVGGNSQPVQVETMPAIGWMQPVRFIKLRRDYTVAIDVLSGFQNFLRFSIMISPDGKMYNSYDTYQAEMMRYHMRFAHNTLMLLGTPVTNPSLINSLNVNPQYGTVQLIDALYNGYYGLIPSLRYSGSAIRWLYPKSTGFDLDRDGERFFLHQNALKRCKEFLVLCGLKFRMDLTRNSTKLIQQQGVGTFMFETYKKGASERGNYPMKLSPDGKAVKNDTDEGWTTTLLKWGIKAYEYYGYTLNTKIYETFSDIRTIGSDDLDNIALFIPVEGVKDLHTGADMNPIEPLQYGDNGYTGDYYETHIDLRTQASKLEQLTGWCTQSMTIAFHGINLFGIAESIDA